MTPICNNLDGVLLSLKACQNLGIVGPDFPQLAKKDASATTLEDVSKKLEEVSKMLEEAMKKLKEKEEKEI